MNNFNKEAFDRLYNTKYVKCEKEQELEDRLMLYYEQSKECSNQLALHYWKDFKHWCNLRCIETKEINRAKKNVAHLIN